MNTSSSTRFSCKRTSLLLLCLILSTLDCRPALPAPVPVGYTEGMVRGFLTLSDKSGARIASGDFLQVLRGQEVKTRVLLQFKDGSLHDETAIFTQKQHFILQSYHLIQKGPSFEQDMDATLERSGARYVVKTKGPKEAKAKVLEGKLELPQDVYNGMVPTVAKNLKGKGATVHMVAFTPTPRLVELEMVPSGEDKVLIGDLKKGVVHYVLKPRLGILLKVGAAVTGNTPPDNELWIMTSDVPAFIKFDGPLATGGPIWSIELTSPVWPKK